jgi:hypothetical protein
MFRKNVTQRQLRRLRQIVVGNLNWFKTLGTDQQNALRPTAYRLTGSKSRIVREINERMYWHHIETLRMRPLLKSSKWEKLVARDKELYETLPEDSYETKRQNRIQFLNGGFVSIVAFFWALAIRIYNLIHYKQTKQFEAEEAARAAGTNR